MRGLQQSSIAMQKLIRLAGQGDRDAISELYLQLKQPIYLLAYSILHSHALAEDVTHDTFIKIMTAAGSYQSSGSARAWILEIGRNTALDLLRREKRYASLDQDTELDDKRLAETEQQLDFLQATKGLSNLDKCIIIYKVFSGLSHVEIAESVGMSAGAVRVRYRRILKRLKRFYSEEK